MATKTSLRRTPKSKEFTSVEHLKIASWSSERIRSLGNKYKGVRSLDKPRKAISQSVPSCQVNRTSSPRVDGIDFSLD